MSAEIDSVLQAAVDAGAVPNVVAMAADTSGPIYEGAAGPRAVGASDPVTPDTMFRIASMTKMVATVAALQLVERGQLDLDDPIETYLPEFGELQVLEGFDGDTPRLRAPASKATVRHLVTHTSGLTYWFWNADMARPGGMVRRATPTWEENPWRRARAWTTCCRPRSMPGTSPAWSRWPATGTA